MPKNHSAKNFTNGHRKIPVGQKNRLKKLMTDTKKKSPKTCGRQKYAAMFKAGLAHKLQDHILKKTEAEKQAEWKIILNKFHRLGIKKQVSAISWILKMARYEDANILHSKMFELFNLMRSPNDQEIMKAIAQATDIFETAITGPFDGPTLRQTMTTLENLTGKKKHNRLYREKREKLAELDRLHPSFT